MNEEFANASGGNARTQSRLLAELILADKLLEELAHNLENVTAKLIPILKPHQPALSGNSPDETEVKETHSELTERVISANKKKLHILSCISDLSKKIDL